MLSLASGTSIKLGYHCITHTLVPSIDLEIPCLNKAAFPVMQNRSSVNSFERNTLSEPV